MAFSTEFVMGAGGAVEVEEIPVSMSGGGYNTNYPLTTVNAGVRAIVFVSGTMVPAHTSTSYTPHLIIGSYTHESPRDHLTGPTGLGIVTTATGSVQVSVRSRYSSTTTFTGTVYVVRL